MVFDVIFVVDLGRWDLFVDFDLIELNREVEFLDYYGKVVIVMFEFDIGKIGKVIFVFREDEIIGYVLLLVFFE